jgi:hypothetical protein
MKTNQEPANSPGPPNSDRSTLRTDLPPEQQAKFERFMIDFDGVFPPPLRPFFRAYVRALLSCGPRQSIRRMATEAGVSTSYLRKMLQDSRWDARHLRDQFRWQVLRDHPLRTGCALLLETKWYETDKTAAATLASGAAPENPPSPAIVHLGLAEGRFRCLLESEPYVPAQWLADGARRESLGISKRHVFRPPWKIALSLLGQARSQGLEVGWLYAPRSFGAELPFLLALGELDCRYVAEVPADLPGWLVPPTGIPMEGSRALGPGRASTPDRIPQRPPHSVRELSMGCPHPERVSVQDPQGPRKVEDWQAGILPFYPADGGLPSSALGLIVLRHEASGETRYFLTNGAMGTSLTDLVRIALSGKPIERQLKEDARATGLHRVSLRGVPMLQRHLVLSAIGLLFRSKMLMDKEAELETSSHQALSTG